MGRNNDETVNGVRIPLNKKNFNALVKAHPEFKAYAGGWHYKNEKEDKIEISLRKFSPQALKGLHEILKAGGEMGDRWLMGQIASHLHIMASAGGEKITQLRALETAIIQFVKHDIINGWIFKRQESTNVLQAMQVDDVYYTPIVHHRGGGSTPAHVTIRCKWWEMGEVRSFTTSWYARDVIGKTVAELLAAEKVYHETPEMVALYEENEKKFMEWRTQLGEQFVGDGLFQEKGAGRWDRHTANLKGTRLIVDDRCAGISNENVTSLFLAAEDSDDWDEGAEEEAKEVAVREEEIDLAEKYSRVPLAHFIWVFSLGSYKSGWVHLDSIKPYIYRPELREKLILSPEHAELIDTLTSEMDVLQEDIISGKSGGTAILCQGVAGTGKTLTAEIYSEVMKKPLYRVHSGQLGTNSSDVEEGLKVALDNAAKWKCPMLIDECDVFISKRGDDMEKNAVVGVFLRLLEYYPGLLFLTTNRTDEVDDAIRSRCIAEIEYNLPDEPERVKLWLTLGGVYGLDVVKGKGMAEKLAKAFVCSGRDIKGLIKLVTKFSHKHGRDPKLEDFKRLAVFKKLHGPSTPPPNPGK